MTRKIVPSSLNYLNSTTMSSTETGYYQFRDQDYVRRADVPNAPPRNKFLQCYDTYRSGLGQGDIWYSGWNLYLSNAYRLYLGGKVSELRDGIRAHQVFCQQHNLPQA